MNGLFVKPMGLEEAIRKREFMLTDNSSWEILDNVALSDGNMLGLLFERKNITPRMYKLLKRDIGDEKTIPRKIVEYFKDGPITLQQAVYAFCDSRAISEFNDRVDSVGCFDENILEELYNSGFVNPHEYLLVRNNSIGRKNGTNIS